MRDSKTRLNGAQGSTCGAHEPQSQISSRSADTDARLLLRARKGSPLIGNESARADGQQATNPSQNGLVRVGSPTGGETHWSRRYFSFPSTNNIFVIHLPS